jgi:hypothetical protein
MAPHGSASSARSVCARSIVLDEPLVDALLGELFAHLPPGEFELGRRVLGVVRVLKVHRDERGTGGEQLTETFGIHGYPGCPVFALANVLTWRKWLPNRFDGYAAETG